MRNFIIIYSQLSEVFETIACANCAYSLQTSVYRFVEFDLFARSSYLKLRTGVALRFTPKRDSGRMSLVRIGTSVT